MGGGNGLHGLRRVTYLPTAGVCGGGPAPHLHSTAPLTRRLFWRGSSKLYRERKPWRNFRPKP